MYIRKSIRGYKGKTYTNYVLVESVHTAKGPRQKTVCSLGDLSPRPRAEWLKLARKIEDALVGQDDLLDAADGEVADIVRRVRARRADRGEVTPAPSLSRTARGALIKVDPSRVTTERPVKPARSTSAISSGSASASTAFCATAGCPPPRNSWPVR